MVGENEQLRDISSIGLKVLSKGLNGANLYQGSGSVSWIRIHKTFDDVDPVGKPTQIIGKLTFLQKYCISKYLIPIKTKPNLAINKKKHCV